MNAIELLEKLIAEQGPKEVKLPGDRTMHLRPLSAEDGVAMGKYLASKGFTEANSETPEAVVAHQSYVVSKSQVELQKGDAGRNKWVKTLDSDRGRHLLSQLAAGVLLKLYQHVLRISDLEVADDEKKDSAQKSDSQESSVSPADSDTAAQKNYGPTLGGSSGSSG